MHRFDRTFTALFLIAGSLAAACGSSGSGSGSGSDPTVPDPGVTPPPGSPGADAAPPEPPKAPIVTGTPDDSEINEMLGIFVAPTGAANGDGSRAHPLLTVQAGIDRARTVGKRVYVCTGTYKEALVIADSISVIAALDCSAPIWKAGAARSRIESPTSPAVLAKTITSPTRLEGLDIVAPNVTAPGASSIGVFADHAAAITLAKSSVKAGDAANGADGVEGTQLTLDEVAATGGDTLLEGRCALGAGGCPALLNINGTVKYWSNASGALGGTSICSGAPNHNGQSGGRGGSTGLYAGVCPPNVPLLVRFWDPYYGASLFTPITPTVGEVRSQLAGPSGQSGAIPAALGSLTADGYVGVSGGAGTDGTPGYGGSGGRGSAADVGYVQSGGVVNGEVWRGKGGPGGGAGGCPGLAGTPGGGGGASIALALIESPLVVDATQLTAGKGGVGGHGTFGSDSTPGGAPGVNKSLDANDAARGGGRGGSAGASANGSSGPSVGIMHLGAPATLVNGGRATAGAGGADLPEQSKTDGGGTRVIPATPAGQSKDVLAL